MDRIQRRTVLRTVGASAAFSTVLPQSVRAAPESNPLKDVSSGFFAPLRESEDVQGTVVGCANRFCETRNAISQETFDTILESGESTETVLRRAKFGVRILTEEYGLTTAVSESMIDDGIRKLGTVTRYIPLAGSFNNCLKAACAVDEDKPKTIKRFLYAVAAFGVEVALWAYGAPYKMAWRGTRFISNRTFLRLAQNGCGSCVALVMSELHWAIRGSIYNADQFVTENRVEFVSSELIRLQGWADEQDIDVTLPSEQAQIRSYIEDNTEHVDSVGGGGALPIREPEGPIQRLIPDLNLDFNFDLPSLSDLF